MPSRKFRVIANILNYYSTRIVKKCKVLICNVLEGNSVFPDFPAFCSEIKNIYKT